MHAPLDAPGTLAEAPPDLLVVGCGYAGRVVALRARAAGRSVRVTTRSAERARALAAEGLEVVAEGPLDASLAEHVGRGTHVLAAFPPDGVTEGIVAAAASSAQGLTWISTTGVYAERAGRIDAATELPEVATDRARVLLEAERRMLAAGGTVLRCPGIYGPDRGLHVRVVRGVHRIPGDGTRHLSRIHVEDLASLVLASRGHRGEVLVVGDRSPAPHIEVVRWICDAYEVPLPPSVPLGDVHVSLRGDRQVDPTHALAALGAELRFPTYQLGMAPAVTGLRRGSAG